MSLDAQIFFCQLLMVFGWSSISVLLFAVILACILCGGSSSWTYRVRRGAFPARILCLMRLMIEIEAARSGHRWHLIRETSSKAPRIAELACGKHIICRVCGEEWDLTNLPPLSPLEQLALCARDEG